MGGGIGSVVERVVGVTHGVLGGVVAAVEVELLVGALVAGEEVAVIVIHVDCIRLPLIVVLHGSEVHFKQRA
jgi:hypothetical protein